MTENSVKKNNFWDDEEDTGVPSLPPKAPEKPKEKFKFKSLCLPLAIFILAVAPRLYFLFFISGTQNAGVGWYNDSYHHWQIAYLTKEIGLSKGFLRLWDLSGMEYFWGLLQPLVLSLLFFITGSADILVSRFLNVVSGGLVVVLLFILTKRYFNLQAALAAALIASLNPVGIFTDVSGMQEPLGILMLLLGIYYWPRTPAAAAFFWFLASISRVEYWLFSIGLIVVTLFSTEKAEKKVPLAVTYGVFIILYLKYLLDKTGNMIYPIYWNFLGNALGQWEANIPLNSEQIQVRYILIFVLCISIICGLVVLIKKPKMYLFSLLGIGNIIFLSSFVGLSEYLKSYLPRFWVDRIFWLPYLWVGFIISVILFYYLPKRLGKLSVVFAWVVTLALVLSIQPLWQPITHYSNSGAKILAEESKRAGEIAQYYQSGSILLPGNDQILTYELYKHGIKGANIRGQMFDPYYYFSTDPYQNWSQYRQQVLDWFKKENVKLLILDPKEARYTKLITLEPDHFKKLTILDNLEIYKVE